MTRNKSYTANWNVAIHFTESGTYTAIIEKIVDSSGNELTIT